MKATTQPLGASGVESGQQQANWWSVLVIQELSLLPLQEGWTFTNTVTFSCVFSPGLTPLEIEKAASENRGNRTFTLYPSTRRMLWQARWKHTAWPVPADNISPCTNWFPIYKWSSSFYVTVPVYTQLSNLKSVLLIFGGVIRLHYRKRGIFLETQTVRNSSILLRFLSTVAYWPPPTL